MLSTSRQAWALDLQIDRRVLLFMILTAVATGLLFGLAPIWRLRRISPQAAMKANERGIAGGHSRFSVGKALVVAQIALSLVLVTGAGLLLGSWRRLVNTDLGFTKDHVLLVGVNIDGGDIPEQQRLPAYHRILDYVRALPGIRNASFSQVTPIGSMGRIMSIKADGFSPASKRDKVIWFNSVSDGYFSTLGTPLRAGRDFTPSDVGTGSRVAIINEAMAKRVFGQQPAVGQRFQLDAGDHDSAPIEVVGVVANAKYRSVRSTDEPIAYLQIDQDFQASAPPVLEFAVRFDGALGPFVASLKAAFAELNPRFVISFTPLEQQVAESLSVPRALATLSGFFGALALLLATIGLYGIMSYSVARRRNEIGVRIALGATQGLVIRMVLGEVVRLVVAGVVIGGGLAFVVTRLVASFLYGVTPTDPTTMGVSAALLGGVALAAAVAPAWRAARIDPVAALREE